MRDIGDVRLAMEGTFEATVSQPLVVDASNLQVWQRPAVAAVAGLALLVIGGLAVWSLVPPASRPITRALLTPPPSMPIKTTSSRTVPSTCRVFTRRN